MKKIFRMICESEDESTIYDPSLSDIDDNSYNSAYLLYNYIVNGHKNRKSGKDWTENSRQNMVMNFKMFDKTVKLNETYETEELPIFVNLKMGWK